MFGLNIDLWPFNVSARVINGLGAGYSCYVDALETNFLVAILPEIIIDVAGKQMLKTTYLDKFGTIYRGWGGQGFTLHTFTGTSHLSQLGIISDSLSDRLASGDRM